MEQRHPTIRVYLTVWATLMALLVVTVLAAIPRTLGGISTVIAMLIAATKAVLIVLYFMHVRYAHRTTWIFASAAFFWLLILLGLTFGDYLTRGWTMGTYGK